MPVVRATDGKTYRVAYGRMFGMNVITTKVVERETGSVGDGTRMYVIRTGQGVVLKTEGCSECGTWTILRGVYPDSFEVDITCLKKVFHSEAPGEEPTPTPSRVHNQMLRPRRRGFRPRRPSQ